MRARFGLFRRLTMLEPMKLYPCISNNPNWPDPAPAHFADDRFDRIWEVIKNWDIGVPGAYGGYDSATGNHVRAILDGIGDSPLLSYESTITLIVSALFDFAALLTGRREVLVCSSAHDAAPMAEALIEFLKARGLENAEPSQVFWRAWVTRCFQ